MNSMGVEHYYYQSASPTERDILRRETTEDPRLRQYMIDKGLGDPLQEPQTAEEIAAADQREAAYLAAKGIVGSVAFRLHQ